MMGADRRVLHDLHVSTDLSFSTFQILAAVSEALGILNLTGGRVLLVGMPMPLPQEAVPGVELVHYNHALGSDEPLQGVHLPFEDSSFALVVACHALEKFASSSRPLLLRELARISGNFLLVISPFDSPIIATGLGALDEIHRSVQGLSHPLVGQLRKLGLPSLDATRIAMAADMGYAPEVVPMTSLRSWALFEMLECVAPVFDRGRVTLSRLNRFYNTRLGRIDHGQPTFRHLLLAHKGSKPLKAGVAKALRETFSPGGSEAEIQTARDLLRLVLDGFAEVEAPMAVPQDKLKNLRRLEELERKSNIQARTIEHLNNEIYYLKNASNSVSTVTRIRKFFSR
ncbi:MAG: class I SAM-dependent methyltransferase [Candidatus Sumerlaeaceae bacterium]|nr:class I SAM-dependent methyltransferase [Candidatus Sumerlaeaceae bacterium]